MTDALMIQPGCFVTVIPSWKPPEPSANSMGRRIKEYQAYRARAALDDMMELESKFANTAEKQISSGVRSPLSDSNTSMISRISSEPSVRDEQNDTFFITQTDHQNEEIHETNDVSEFQKSADRPTSAASTSRVHRRTVPKLSSLASTSNLNVRPASAPLTRAGSRNPRQHQANNEHYQNTARTESTFRLGLGDASQVLMTSRTQSNTWLGISLPQPRREQPSMNTTVQSDQCLKDVFQNIKGFYADRLKKEQNQRMARQMYSIDRLVHGKPTQPTPRLRQHDADKQEKNRHVMKTFIGVVKSINRMDGTAIVTVWLEGDRLMPTMATNDNESKREERTCRIRDLRLVPRHQFKKLVRDRMTQQDYLALENSVAPPSPVAPRPVIQKPKRINKKRLYEKAKASIVTAMEGPGTRNSSAMSMVSVSTDSIVTDFALTKQPTFVNPTDVRPELKATGMTAIRALRESITQSVYSDYSTRSNSIAQQALDEQPKRTISAAIEMMLREYTGNKRDGPRTPSLSRQSSQSRLLPMADT